jgi:hypothetical protein
MRMVLIPSNCAISHACWPPAPPKLASLAKMNITTREREMGETDMCFDVANPRASVSARIGLHIVSFATLMNLCHPAG